MDCAGGGRRRILDARRVEFDRDDVGARSRRVPSHSNRAAVLGDARL